MRALSILVTLGLYSVTSRAAGSASQFANLISSAIPNAVTSSLRPACLEALRRHVGRNDSFASVRLHDYLIPLSQVSSRAEIPGTFFHYTNAQPMIEIASTRDFDSEFSFLRKVGRSSPMQWNLYLAADSMSSRDYGSIQVRLHLDPNALMFDPLIKMPSLPRTIDETERQRRIIEAKVQTTDAVESELIAKDPNLENCVFTTKERLHQHAEDFSVLMLLALQESKVALVSYYGFVNAAPPYWFALIGAESIQEWTASRTGP